ncbi:uncharacterized protein L203_103640 [Cryptococcus depauperatus CBS 7841]|uniref:Uncharacterized protein n=1 Tax=Cryptococcus depauperatus CBS 7841 TaxID=1295531 RepID=A0A1E3HD42_9TREE|nr:hypothetical protein L203_06637 [Cryptococcus depauperatus CBS 7841]
MADNSLNLSRVTIAGCVLRLAAFTIPVLSESLQRRPELSTLQTSFRNLKEGVFLYDRNTNPYIAGAFSLSPLYLFFFSWITPVSFSALTALIWTLADLFSSYSLVKVQRSRSGGCSKEVVVAALFLFNPCTLLVCLSRSTTAVDNALLLYAISAATQGQVTVSMLMLSITVHTSLYPIVLLGPMIMLLNKMNAGARVDAILLQSMSVFTICFMAITAINFCFFGPYWVYQTWGVIITAVDLSPNVGMWWYFFTEMFDHFRGFFLGVFQLHIFIYIVPVCIRFYDKPLESILILSGVFVTWKSYPSLGDMSLWAGLLSCFPEILANLRHPLFSLTVNLYTSILLPLLHSLWLLTGTGNANFFYAATMVYGLNASLTVVDVVGAVLRADVKKAVEDWKAEKQLEKLQGQCSSMEPVETDWQAVQFSS